MRLIITKLISWILFFIFVLFQLGIAYKHEEYHRDLFGYKEKNTQFVKGYIEDLKAASLKDGEFDIVV